MAQATSLKSKLIKAAYFAVFVLVGMGTGYAIGGFMKGRYEIGADPLWLLATPISIFAALFLHEAGHALGGRLAGFQLQLLAAGPVRFDRRPEGWRTSLNRSPGLWGGVAASVPEPDSPRGLKDLPRRMMQMVVGGPLASILVGILGFLLAWWAGPGPARLLLGFLGLTSAAIALATAIPQCFGGFKSDGQRILELWRGGAEAERWCALASLSAIAVKERPRNWPTEIVHMATAYRDESNDGVSAVWLRHSWHLDRGERDEAKHWIEQALTLVQCWPSAARPIIYSSAAYFYAMEDHDAKKAQQYFELSRASGFLPPEGRQLAEAAAACANGEFEAARSAARRGRELARNHAGTAGQAMREYFELIEARASQ